MKIIFKGGPGSGFRSHMGRLGKVGGSLPGTVNTFNLEQLVNAWINTSPDMSQDIMLCNKIFGRTDMNEYDIAKKFQRMYQTTDPKTGIYSEINRIAYNYNNTMKVSGIIYDSTNSKIGRFVRTISHNGEVEHDYFEMDSEHQKSGFGSMFFQHNEDEYIRNGFSRISVHAGLSVGGYVWARLGFDWIEKPSWIYNKLIYEWKSRYNSELNTENLKHSWDIASLTGPDGYKIGKYVLLGTDWYGYKDLKPGSVGLTIGDLYYYAKQSEKKSK